jgi:3-phenylpropionate/trans-cinnamate dioxygenase ferredoxin reductase component
MQHVVVVGGSLAGIRTAESLRSQGFSGRLTLVGAEAQLPYDRPPLSKGYLEGKRTVEQLSLSQSDPSFKNLDATFLLGASAVSVDLSPQAIELSDGTRQQFDGLVIATGARARSLPGTDDLSNVHTLRTITDADRLRSTLVAGARIVIIGAGFIGAEVASTAKALGCEVVIVEALPVPLSRQLGSEMGAAVSDLHERNGVKLLADETVLAVGEDAVTLSSGIQLPYDQLLVGVGVIPNTEWLAGSGIDTSNGVLCDENLRVYIEGVPSPNIVAVGDIARWTNPKYAYEGPVRVEHWTNAVETAQHGAATLLGNPTPFAPVPYFWSDQYGKKIQFLGRAAEYDEVAVVAGSTDDKFVALYRRQDQLVAALGVSSIKALMGYRQRLIDGCSWDDALAAASA